MIDDFRNLSDGALMRERGLFVAEGRLVVRRVIEESEYRVHSVLLNEATRRALSDVLDQLPPDTPVHVQPTEAFREITGFTFHRGCLALVHRPPASTVDSIVNGSPPIVMLEGVTDADNVGSVFRNAAAFGVAGVLLSPGCCDPLYRKAIRTSMAAVLRVPFARASDWPAVIRRLQAQGFTVTVLTPRESAETVDAFARRVRGTKVALVIGTEGAGVSAATAAVADAHVRIPMAGGVDSLNLSVASGIALFALRS